MTTSKATGYAGAQLVAPCVINQERRYGSVWIVCPSPCGQYTQVCLSNGVRVGAYSSNTSCSAVTYRSSGKSLHPPPCCAALTHSPSRMGIGDQPQAQYRHNHQSDLVPTFLHYQEDPMDEAIGNISLPIPERTLRTGQNTCFAICFNDCIFC